MRFKKGQEEIVGVKISKRGQEEIVGFVLIILLVSVIAVIFLAISVRKPIEKLPSSELESFLQSSMRISTDCYVSQERVYSFKEVISSCAETNDLCLNKKTACDILNETAARILKDNWRVCGECPVKSYKFTVSGESNRTIYRLREGNCSGNRVYSDLGIHAYSGKVTVELEVCG